MFGDVCAAFVADRVGRSSVWDGPRGRVFLVSEGFAERQRGVTSDPQRLRELPGVQRRALARPVSAFGAQYGNARGTMARACATGVYTMMEIVAHFGVHYSTVSRAVRWLERADAGLAAPKSSYRMQMTDFAT